jgi:hypothetical protein
LNRLAAPVYRVFGPTEQTLLDEALDHLAESRQRCRGTLGKVGKRSRSEPFNTAHQQNLGKRDGGIVHKRKHDPGTVRCEVDKAAQRISDPIRVIHGASLWHWIGNQAIYLMYINCLCAFVNRLKANNGFAQRLFQAASPSRPCPAVELHK